MPDPSTFAEALEVLDTRGGRGAFPPAVVASLQRGDRGEMAETPKADDPRIKRSDRTHHRRTNDGRRRSGGGRAIARLRMCT